MWNTEWCAKMFKSIWMKSLKFPFWLLIPYQVTLETATSALFHKYSCKNRACHGWSTGATVNVWFKRQIRLYVNKSRTYTDTSILIKQARFLCGDSDFFGTLNIDPTHWFLFTVLYSMNKQQKMHTCLLKNAVYSLFTI